MAALGEGARAQEERPVNLCLEIGSFFPLPLPGWPRLEAAT